MIRISTLAIVLAIILPAEAAIAAPTVNAFPMLPRASKAVLGNVFAKNQNQIKNQNELIVAREGHALVQLHRALMHGDISPRMASEFENRILQLDASREPEALLKIETSIADCLSAPPGTLEEIGAASTSSSTTSPNPKAVGTIILQDQLLNRIDDAVKNGEISKIEAQVLVNKINGICAEECKYVSREELVPPAIVAQDRRLLDSLSNSVAAPELK